jgi:hypothetical protein
MPVRTRTLWVSIFAGAAACASTLQERRDYILAHPHGWVELSVDDRAVPAVPESDGEPDRLVRPYSCSVDVSLEREPFVNGSAYPMGDAAPYAVKTGFRFPAPVGRASIAVEYRGCDGVQGEDAVTKTVELSVAVEEGRVVEVHFDGEALAADPPRENPVVTLDDVYEAVTGKKKGAP